MPVVDCATDREVIVGAGELGGIALGNVAGGLGAAGAVVVVVLFGAAEMLPVAVCPAVVRVVVFDGRGPDRQDIVGAVTLGFGSVFVGSFFAAAVVVGARD